MNADQEIDSFGRIILIPRKQAEGQEPLPQQRFLEPESRDYPARDAVPIHGNGGPRRRSRSRSPAGNRGGMLSHRRDASGPFHPTRQPYGRGGEGRMPPRESREGYRGPHHSDRRVSYDHSHERGKSNQVLKGNSAPSRLLSFLPVFLL